MQWVMDDPEKSAVEATTSSKQRGRTQSRCQAGESSKSMPSPPGDMQQRR
eukprot:CAMPEP_0195002814 /NCGR_PEP_ID=MMETSP0326_2-20130528/3031_1 /TAXON_ID=2866 ORGANISM="Crypthecodinium cohnii, Strain Seligo" /NCGR_SAMPLE_ID=MMETSP0326_2 /ASSEMBLY_ACC=CAM_ASM_000348 /LENGTH=49 /DNA_ID= /DNA_START= /DNA_END= /DNA_ORIENTATION=